LNLKILIEKHLFWASLACIGYGIFAYSYLLAWQANNNIILFWVGLGISCFCLFVGMLKSNKNYIIFILLVFLGFIIFSTYLFRTSSYFVNRDEMNHYQGYSSIIKKGNLHIEHTNFPVIESYPGLELLVATLVNITSIPQIIGGKILVGITHSFLLIILWLYFIKLGLNKHMATISSFLYAFNPRFIFFDCNVSYETIALPMVFMIFLFLRYKSCMKKTLIFVFLSLITLCSLVITHHSSPYMLLLYGIFLSIIYIYHNRDKGFNCLSPINFTVIVAVLTFGWLIYVATQQIYYVSGNIVYKIMDIVHAGNFFGKGPEAALAIELEGIPMFEIIIRKFLYPPTLLFLCVLGIYIYFKRNNVIEIMQSIEASALIIWAIPTFLATWPLLIATQFGAELGGRVWAFLFAGVAFVLTVAYRYLWSKNIFITKLVVIITIFIIFISGVSLARSGDFRFPFSKPTSELSFYTKDIFYASNWLATFDSTHLEIAGTHVVMDVFGGYGEQFVKPWLAAPLFLKEKIDDDFIDKVIRYNYIVSDIRNTYMRYSNLEDIFYRPLKEPVMGPLPNECLNKFDIYPRLEMVYTNGNIKLYKVFI